jgi:hypothetical protein
MYVEASVFEPGDVTWLAAERLNVGDAPGDAAR